MKKNTKGIIGLTAGILSFASIVMTFVPLYQLAGTSIKFLGAANVYFGIAAGVLALIAIVFGIMSRKDADKKGPRKAGVIIGAFALIIAMFSTGIAGLGSMITDYANHVEGNTISQMNSKTREPVDKMLLELKAMKK